MKKFQKLIALTAVMTLLSASANSQEPVYYDDTNAYADSSYATYATAAIPVAVLIAAGVIIATTDHHHHHSSSSSSSSSSHSHSHSHF